jgi:hypothetical protein
LGSQKKKKKKKKHYVCRYLINFPPTNASAVEIRHRISLEPNYRVMDRAMTLLRRFRVVVGSGLEFFWIEKLRTKDR